VRFWGLATAAIIAAGIAAAAAATTANQNQNEDQDPRTVVAA